MHVTASAIELGVPGIETESFAIVLDCLGRAAFARKHDAETVLRFGVSGPQANGFRKASSSSSLRDAVAHFREELEALQGRLLEMGGLAEKQIADAVSALAKRDSALAQRVTQADANIDTLQHEIEEKAVLTIARRQPMAVDLREIVSAMRVAVDLERIGDLAKNIGKRVTAIESDFQPLKLIRGLEHMTDLVQSQVKSVLDAYAAHDLPAAMVVWKGDEEVDAICTSLFRELLTYMMEDPRNISFCIHLMFCAKNIERIGDHATNIAETVFYMIEGQQILDKRPKGDMTTFATTVPGN